MKEALAIMKDKYETGPNPKPKESREAAGIKPRIVGTGSEPKVLNRWQESKPVVRLSNYLKQHKHHGIFLVKTDGKATLHFEPGLHPKDKKRWDMARTATALFTMASKDLTELMKRRKINLTQHPGGTITRKLWTEQ